MKIPISKDHGDAPEIVRGLISEQIMEILLP